MESRSLKVISNRKTYTFLVLYVCWHLHVLECVQDFCSLPVFDSTIACHWAESVDGSRARNRIHTESVIENSARRRALLRKCSLHSIEVKCIEIVQPASGECCTQFCFRHSLGRPLSYLPLFTFAHLKKHSIIIRFFFHSSNSHRLLPFFSVSLFFLFRSLTEPRLTESCTLIQFG